MAGSIRDADKGMRKIVRSMADAASASGTRCVVGWPETAGAHTGGEAPITNAQLAAIHEYGTARIPARSMLGATFDLHRAKYAEQLRKIGLGITRGKTTTRDGLALIGVIHKGDVQQRIADGIAPPNSPVTIKRKGSSKPLIDTGQLRQSLNHEVRGG